MSLHTPQARRFALPLAAVVVALLTTLAGSLALQGTAAVAQPVPPAPPPSAPASSPLPSYPPASAPASAPASNPTR